jgi:hypothetical protein
MGTFTSQQKHFLDEAYHYQSVYCNVEEERLNKCNPVRCAWHGALLRAYFVFIHGLLILLPFVYLQFPRVFDETASSYRAFCKTSDTSLRNCNKRLIDVAPELDSLGRSRTVKSGSPHTSSSIYAGHPTEESNKAWNKLIERKYADTYNRRVSVAQEHQRSTLMLPSRKSSTVRLHYSRSTSSERSKEATSLRLKFIISCIVL